MRKLSPSQTESCLTPAEARAGFKALILSMQEGTCRFTRFQTSGERLSAQVQCAAAAGTSSTIQLAGVAGSERSRMTLAIEQRSASIPGGVAQIDMAVASVRIGDC